jgi:hypothetical protein
VMEPPPHDAPSLKTRLVIVALSITVGAGIALFGVHLARAHIDRYPVIAEQGFLDTCIHNGTTASRCTCVLRGLERRFTDQQFSAMTDEYQRSGALPEGALEAVAACGGFEPQPSRSAPIGT